MADAKVTFNDKNFTKFITKVQKKLKLEKKQVVGLFSAIVVKDVISHFEKEEGPSGKWDRWSEGYKKQLKRRSNPPQNILADTGKLRNGLKPGNVQKKGSGFIWFNDTKTKSGFPYAKAHDVGGKTLPQREFMWLSKAGLEGMAKSVLAFLRK